MANLIFDNSRLKVYEYLRYLTDFAGLEENFSDTLWKELLENEELYEEFLYYLNNHSLKDRIKIEGYSLTDLYVYMLGKSNLITDTGKNTAECNKEAMVLNCFMAMAELMKDPTGYIKRLNEGRGMDKL